MDQVIEEGHGLEDISCEHGSRWIWWPGPDGKGAWMDVIKASNCDCGEPPRPHKEEAEDQEPLEEGFTLGPDAQERQELDDREVLEEDLKGQEAEG